MSGWVMAQWKRAALQFPCEICGVPPGKHCITNTGNKKTDVHAERSRRASEEGWRLLDD